jgi:hypothetical protein
MSKYDDVLISKKTKSGMSLTADDQLWLKRIMDRQDECIEQYISDTYDKHATLICDAVRELLNEYRKEIFESLARIEKSIEDLKKDIKDMKVETLDLKNRIVDHEFRIQRIEKHLNL